ncbi:hypothetical protein NUU35_24620, partial [Escherichia coli]|nr:hypothetical protein [Escherichia coli]
STSKTPSYTKSVSWQHHPLLERITFYAKKNRDELDKISCKWCCD